jgi:plastocyanin
MATAPNTPDRTTREDGHMKKITTTLLLALALGGFVLTGCSDDSDSSDDASSDEATTDDSASGESGGGSEATDAVTIVDFAFDPEGATVAAGSTITFTNEDGATHTATADDDSFDTGDLEQGDSAEVTLDEPGDLSYFCDIHNYMTGTITVE